MNIIRFGEETTPDIVGGKGYSLSRLFSAGLPVPLGFCVTTEGTTSVEVAELEVHLVELGARSYAVRSSATQEDAKTTSFAGIYLSRLNIPDPPGVLSALHEIRAAALAPAATGYSARCSLAEAPRLAAVVQTFVPADISGVLFTRDPVDGSAHLVVEASWGLAETVVAGLVCPDRWVVSPDGDVLSSSISDKDVAAVAAGTGGTRQVRVDGPKRKRPCLSPDALAKLVKLARECERLFGWPQDIEWAIASNQLWILQARPITCP